jgi:hypothetical protein
MWIEYEAKNQQSHHSFGPKTWAIGSVYQDAWVLEVGVIAYEVPFSIFSFFLYFHILIYLNYVTQLLHYSMLQLQLFDTYSNLFSSMEQQLHKEQFPLMLFKNITKKRDVKERIFCTTQETFVRELRTDIVQDLKKLTSSTNFCMYTSTIPSILCT